MHLVSKSQRKNRKGMRNSKERGKKYSASEKRKEKMQGKPRGFYRYQKSNEKEESSLHQGGEHPLVQWHNSAALSLAGEGGRPFKKDRGKKS